MAGESNSCPAFRSSAVRRDLVQIRGPHRVLVHDVYAFCWPGSGIPFLWPRAYKICPVGPMVFAHRIWQDFVFLSLAAESLTEHFKRRAAVIAERVELELTVAGTEYAPLERAVFKSTKNNTKVPKEKHVIGMYTNRFLYRLHEIALSKSCTCSSSTSHSRWGIQPNCSQDDSETFKGSWSGAHIFRLAGRKHAWIPVSLSPDIRLPWHRPCHMHPPLPFDVVIPLIPRFLCYPGWNQDARGKWSCNMVLAFLPKHSGSTPPHHNHGIPWYHALPKVSSLAESSHQWHLAGCVRRYGIDA